MAKHEGKGEAALQPATDNRQSLAAAVEAAHSKLIETLSTQEREKQARVARAYFDYAHKVAEIRAKRFRAWLESYEQYLEAFSKLGSTLDASALSAVIAAWTTHVETSSHSEEALIALKEAEKKQTCALSEIQGASDEAVRAATTAYSDAVNAALVPHGLVHLSAEHAQLIAREIIARTAATAQTL